MNIEFEIEKSDLVKDKWVFWVNDATLVLAYYSRLERESKRHKHKVIAHYDRIMKRNSTITAEDTPLTFEVRNKATNLLIEKISVTI